MYNFKFADIGEGIHEGQILKWLFKVGDTVKEGETLCIVETDKVNAEIPSPVDGKIIKLGAEVGQTIHVGNTLVLIDDGSASLEEAKVEAHPAPEATEEKGSGVVGEIEVGNEVIASATTDLQESTKKRILATPLARRVASELGVDIQKVSGTGEQGRVLKDDILAAAEKEKVPQAPAPQVKLAPMPSFAPELTTHVPLTKMRKTISKNMTTSKQTIPHVTMMDEFNVSRLVEFRKGQKDLAAQAGVKLTYMAFIVKAITKVLKEFPIFNATYDHEQEEIIYKHYINVGIAVDTSEGLMVPNIKNADKLSIFEIANEIEKLSKAANDRSIQLPQLQNGTFTITNYGAVDALYGTPIIYHPEVAIIGVGKITQKPIVENGQIVIADLLPLSIAFDHRVIDGADAGRFTIRLKQLLSNPMLLLLS